MFCKTPAHECWIYSATLAASSFPLADRNLIQARKPWSRDSSRVQAQYSCAARCFVGGNSLSFWQKNKGIAKCCVWWGNFPLLEASSKSTISFCLYLFCLFCCCKQLETAFGQHCQHCGMQHTCTSVPGTSKQWRIFGLVLSLKCQVYGKWRQASSCNQPTGGIQLKHWTNSNLI